MIAVRLYFMIKRGPAVTAIEIAVTAGPGAAYGAAILLSDIR